MAPSPAERDVQIVFEAFPQTLGVLPHHGNAPMKSLLSNQKLINPSIGSLMMAETNENNNEH